MDPIEIGSEVMNWVHLAKVRDRWQVLVSLLAV
jgi:hypothetical protein